MSQSTSPQVEFCSEPPPAPKRVKWTELLTPLINKPGVWAKLRGLPHTKQGRLGLVTRLNKGLVNLPAGKWIARTYEGEIYICYVGPNA